jgi:hypothetical protein
MNPFSPSAANRSLMAERARPDQRRQFFHRVPASRQKGSFNGPTYCQLARLIRFSKLAAFCAIIAYSASSLTSITTLSRPLNQRKIWMLALLACWPGHVLARSGGARLPLRAGWCFPDTSWRFWQFDHGRSGTAIYRQLAYKIARNPR